MLTVRQHMQLQTEDLRWKYQGAKDTFVREQLGLAPTVNAAQVNRLIDDPEAIACYPMLCARLRRLREARREVRRAS